MKIVIATPLFPPDIGGSARYAKELAGRLATRHEVTAVIYGHLPEKVEGVSFVTVDKRLPLFLRLMQFTLALSRAVRGADILYAENGPSVELPAGLVTLFVRKPLVAHIGDAAAHEYAQTHFIRKYIERFAFQRVMKVIKKSPLPKPEILPFEPFPQSAFSAYKKSWQEHIATLEKLFEHARKK